MRQVRGLRGWCGIVALAGSVWACETARNPGGVQLDLIPPAIKLKATADTEQIASGLSFSITASDNLSLADIQLTYTGGYIAQTDTAFTSQTKSFGPLTQVVTFPANSGAGGLIKIVGKATDGAGNFAVDSIFIFLSNVQALKVFLNAPSVGAVASQGKRIVVQVHASQLGGIQRIGFLVQPRTALSAATPLAPDSLIFVGNLPPDTTFTDTLTVLAGSGTFTVTGFAMDAAGRRGFSNTVTVIIQSAVNDVLPPIVSHTISSRVEVTDSITVHATDPSAISLIGFQIDTSLTLTAPPLKFVTVNVSAANLTDVTRTFSLGLASLLSKFPKLVVARGYACDLDVPVNHCAYSTTSTVFTSGGGSLASSGTDTVTVVAGFTRPLPLGGAIADAIYDSTRRELYLKSPKLSRV